MPWNKVSVHVHCKIVFLCRLGAIAVDSTLPRGVPSDTSKGQPQGKVAARGVAGVDASMRVMGCASGGFGGVIMRSN